MAAKNSAVKQTDWKEDLEARVAQYIAIADQGEPQRRRTDRIGGRLLYDQHWLVNMPQGKAAVIANVGKALLEHKIAIMTKQDPIPVIQPDGVGDADGARLMNLVVQRLWHERSMKIKNRKALRLCNATRTSAVKVVWDPILSGGIGDIDYDVIPGWRLILDNRCSDPTRMQFIGDRARMPRSRAMRLYPEAVDEIEAGLATARRTGGLTTEGSPITDPWNSGVSITQGVASVNNQPVILSAMNSGPSPASVINEDPDVEIVELYHRDPTMFEDEDIERDHLGKAVDELDLGEDGEPQFDQSPDELVQVPGLDLPVSIPRFTLRTKPRIKKELKPKYPFYRRTTMMFPGNVTLDDRAWDGPHPYALYTDEVPLDGCQGKGSLLGLFTLQGVLNVGISCMTDNIRQGSMQAFKAGAQANLENDQLIITPGRVIKMQDEKALVALEVQNISGEWIQFNNHIIDLMKFIYGSVGVMQGEAQGRVDSAAGVDTLAEIGGSRVVECTQRMASSIGDLARITGWYAQRYYTERHAVAVEDVEGNITWERVWGEQLQGSFSYGIAEGSTLAWSETAQEARTLNRMAQGLYDKTEVWKLLKVPNWKEIKQRIATDNPAVVGPAGMPPPRTRGKQQSTKSKQNGALAHS